MRVVRRGKFSTLVNRDGTPVTAELYKCVLANDPHVARSGGDKMYATLDLTYARGAGVGVLQNVSTRIDKEAAPEFSPLRPDKTLVVKFPAGGAVRHETREGVADAPFVPVAGQAVDVVLRLGAFGSFGYCWLVSRIKPHEASEP
jgi:hypothetical protein